MTVQELIDILNDFPREKSIKFYVWDEIEEENVPCIFNSIEDKENVHIYLESDIIL